MPDTPIDLSEGIQSVRLKVPTAEVPIPPEGFAQLHSPAPGELALRLPDGSVVAIGGGGGGGGAATSVLGPGGAIDAANTDPRIGININAAPGTGIAFTGKLLDQFARPLGAQVERTLVSSAEIQALHTIPKVIVPAQGAGLAVAVLLVTFRVLPGDTPYAAAGGTLIRVGKGADLNYYYGINALTLLNVALPTVRQLVTNVWQIVDVAENVDNQPLVLSAEEPITSGNGTLLVSTLYQAV